MAVPRSKSQRERDRLRVSELYLQGLTQAEIAREIGVSTRTVWGDIQALLKEWSKQRENIADEFEGRYRYIYREAISAWLDSRKDKETQTQESVEGGGEAGNGKERIKAQLRTEGQSGNPALLAQAQAALKAIREMLGTDKPVEQKISILVEQELEKALDTLENRLPPDVFNAVITALAGEVGPEATEPDNSGSE